MGANEKYEAAMHGYVPSTEQIRNCYGQRWYEQTEKQSDAEFDLWLEAVRAEAKAEALTDLVNTSLETRKISKFQAAWIRGLAREYTQGPHKIVGAFATPETNKENQS